MHNFPNFHAKISNWNFSSQEIGASLVSFQMIFEALQSEQLRFKFYSLGSKTLHIWSLDLETIRTSTCLNVSFKDHLFSVNIVYFTTQSTLTLGRFNNLRFYGAPWFDRLGLCGLDF